MADADRIRDLARRIQSAIAESRLEDARALLDLYFATDGADRLWGRSILQTVLRKMLG